MYYYFHGHIRGQAVKVSNLKNNLAFHKWRVVGSCPTTNTGLYTVGSDDETTD